MALPAAVLSALLLPAMVLLRMSTAPFVSRLIKAPPAWSALLPLKVLFTTHSLVALPPSMLLK